MYFSMTTYLVNEIYSCLQGEGPSIGRPSLLVRFQICNLRCTWCDTPYTHTLKSDPHAHRFTLEKLVERIGEFSQRHLILTGGEPTLHHLGHLMRALGSHYSGEVETNGTRIPHLHLPGFLPSDYALLQWNVSPKFENAGEQIVPEALAHWAALAQKQERVYFKFVIRKSHSKDDIAQTLSIAHQYKIEHSRIYLMPEGTTVESQLSNTWLHDLCLEHGMAYTPRLHILLFGNKRGV
jgi:7-carboxy-7-deazaguanine synthase